MLCELYLHFLKRHAWVRLRVGPRNHKECPQMGRLQKVPTWPLRLQVLGRN